MKFLSMSKAVAMTVLLSIAALPAMAQSLTTTYAGGNGQDGNIFDLNPAVDLTLDGFDINLDGQGDQATIEVYWRAGTADGFQDSPAGWTLLGSADVISQGAGNPTAAPIGGLALVGGQTYGIYLHVVENENGNGLNYTDGGPTTFSNADLALTSYYGKSNGETLLSGSNYFPRQWNGTVYYTKGAATTCASEGYKGAKLTWCQNICENGLTGQVLDTWIHRWINRYRDLPYCAVEEEEEQKET